MECHENRLEKNITYKIFNYENFDNNLKLAFFWRWQSGWKLCLKINAIKGILIFKKQSSALACGYFT